MSKKRDKTTGAPKRVIIEMPKPTYAQLERRIKMLENRIAIQDTDASRAAFQQGFDIGSQFTIEQFEIVINDNADLSSLLALVTVVLAEIRALVFQKQAGLNNNFYFGRLKQLQKELADRYLEWEQTVIERDKRWSEKTTEPVKSLKPQSPMMLIVSEVNDGIREALKGDDSLLQKTFSNHQWYNDMQTALAQVNRGGHPGGKYSYSTYLDNYIRRLHVDNPKWTPAQIANHIIYKLSDKAKKEGLNTLEQETLNKLATSKRPDEIVRKRLNAP